MKSCGNCGRDISDRAPQARYCAEPTCLRERGRVHGRESWVRIGDDQRAKRRAQYAVKKAAEVAAHPQVVRFCAHCNRDISHRGNRARWCDMRCREKFRHAANPARARDKAATWRAANPERNRELLDRWRAANPESYRHQVRRAQQKRRAWKLSSSGSGMDERTWNRLVARHRGRCAYCRQAPTNGDLTQDHVVPLARGGSNYEGNIVPACSPCNNSKNDKLLIEWRTGRRISRKDRTRTANRRS